MEGKMEDREQPKIEGAFYHRCDAENGLIVRDIRIEGHFNNDKGQSKILL